MSKVPALSGVVIALGIGLASAQYGLLAPAVLATGVAIALATLALLRWPERGLWAMAALLPYERLGTLGLGLLTLKGGHLISAAMLVSWGARSLIQQSFKLAADPLRVPLLLLLAASVLSLINAPDLARSGTLIVQLLIGFTIYLLTINFLPRSNLRGTLLAVWIGSAIVGLFGLYQFVGDLIGLPVTLTGLLPSYSGEVNFGFARIQGPSLEPLYFANYLLLPILTAAAFLFGTTTRRRWWLVPLLLLLGVVFVLTLARGAFLALAIAGLWLVILYRREIFTPRVIASLAISSAVIILAVVALLVQNATTRGGDPLTAFANQIGVTGSDVSSQQRFGAIEAASRLVADYPLTGVGIGNFGEYYQDPLTQSTATQKTQVVNNQTLETLVETGVLGLLSLLLVGWVVGDRTRQALLKVGSDRVLRAALVGTAATAIAIVVQAQTFSALYLLHVWFVLGLLVAVQNLILVPEPAR